MSEHQPALAASPSAWPRAVFAIAIAIAFSTFQIVTAAFHPVSSQVLRAVHVGFLLLMIFLTYPMVGRGRPWQPLAWLLGLAGMATAAYQWFFEADLIQRSGELTDWDMAVGVLLILLVFEAARRVMGIALPIICGLFLAYALLGQYLPGDLAHRGYGVDQLVNQLSFGTEGLYGTPTYVSATYIFLFILFGAFLEHAGMIRLFTDFAMGYFGHKVGGPAKVSVVSSALMGTITGSGVANVVTTGQFTIPLMMRFGYRPAFAGGVESTASMGSQLMPPVMGAVAFIMAETIDVPFAGIAKAALLPALLYFGSVFWMVHLEAKRGGLRGLPKSECPDPWAAVRARWFLLIPLAVLIWLLFSGRTPLFAGTVGLALTAIVILGSAIILRVSSFGLRLAFWIALGVLCTGFFQLGIGVIVGVIAALVVACWFVKGGRETLRICLYALAEGPRHALPVGIACALVGVIIGVVSLTGVASTFASFILAIGQNSLFLSLVLTMLTCLVLGMGIPTIPNYIIASSIAAPALLDLGVPLIVSHMFVFYFGILADLTPPVALACFAAAPIAGERGLKISLWAVRIALAGFVVPFMAVYNQALTLQGDNLLMSAFMFAKTAVAIGLWGGRIDRLLPGTARLVGAAAGDVRRSVADPRDPRHRYGGIRARRPSGRPAPVATAPGRDRMIGLCIGLAGMVWADLPANRFTLTWPHSIERVPWEEDYCVTPEGLVLTEARIKGAGAGMEPPEGAKYRDGAWHYRPDLPPIQPLRLARTPEAGDYDVCLDRICHPLSHWIGLPRADRPAVELWACRLSGGAGHEVKTCPSARALIKTVDE